MKQDKSTSTSLNLSFIIYFSIILFAICSINANHINDFISSIKKPVHFESSGISFDYPKNLETKSGYGIFYANFFRSNDGNHKLFIDSIHVKLYSQTTIKELIEETVNSKNKLQPKYVIVKEQNMTIGGKNATSALFIGVNISELTIKTEKIFIQNGDNIYVFELQTREDRFKRGKKDFDKIIQSIKFT